MHSVLGFADIADPMKMNATLFMSEYLDLTTRFMLALPGLLRGLPVAFYYMYRFLSMKAVLPSLRGLHCGKTE